MLILRLTLIRIQSAKINSDADTNTNTNSFKQNAGINTNINANANTNADTNANKNANTSANTETTNSKSIRLQSTLKCNLLKKWTILLSTTQSELNKYKFSTRYEHLTIVYIQYIYVIQMLNI